LGRGKHKQVHAKNKKHKAPHLSPPLPLSTLTRLWGRGLNKQGVVGRGPVRALMPEKIKFYKIAEATPQHN